MKENKGITLIALVITIIVLLILAGISIALLLGKEGIIEQTKKAVFLTEYREIEEQIVLYSSEKHMEKIEEKSKEIELFPLSTSISQEEKESWRTNKIELVEQIEEKTKNNLQNTNLYWIDFSKITTKVTHQYIIDLNTQMIFDYEGHIFFEKKHHIPEEIEAKNQTVTKPEFETVYEYPILRSNGIEKAGTVRIRYPEGSDIKKYYSLDNITWKEYTEPICLEKSGIVYAKARNINTGVETINSIEVTIDSKRIGEKAYDGNWDTYENSGKIGSGYKYMYVDPSVWEESIEFKLGWRYAQLRCLNEKQEVLESSQIPGVNSGIITTRMTIPKDTKYIVLYCSSSGGDGALLYEINIATKPEINVIQKAYPILNSTGIREPFMKLTITKGTSKNIAKTIYSKDNINWEEYRDQEIELEVGQTIYAKNILVSGEETEIVSKICTEEKKAITKNAYDNNETTYVNSGTIGQGYKYMLVDSSAIGHEIEAKVAYMYAQLRCLDENENVLYASGIPGSSGGRKTVRFNIVEGTKYLVLYCSSSGGDGALLYEIKLVE